MSLSGIGNDTHTNGQAIGKPQSAGRIDMTELEVELGGMQIN